jgi:hypothetical protein
MFDDFGYEEHLRDEATHDDYMREAYGDPCPRHGTLRYGGDCGRCEMEAEEDFEPTEPTTEAGIDDVSEDYPGQRISGPDEDFSDDILF